MFAKGQHYYAGRATLPRISSCFKTMRFVDKITTCLSFFMWNSDSDIDEVATVLLYDGLFTPDALQCWANVTSQCTAPQPSRKWTLTLSVSKYTYGYWMRLSRNVGAQVLSGSARYVGPRLQTSYSRHDQLEQFLTNSRTGTSSWSSRTHSGEVYGT